MTTTTQAGATLQGIRETVERAASKVFGEPIHQEGMTVLPVAAVATGGGGGGGSAPSRKGEQSAAQTGEGGGFGLMAKPAGAFMIKDGTVEWRPAIDVNRVIMGGQIVAAVALVVVWAIVRSRR